MHITNLRIDRLGAWSDLQLDALSRGLNVLYGPNGSGKTTIVQFIRAMLYGFDGDRTLRSFPADLDRSGGTLTVQTRVGSETIHRREGVDAARRLVIESAHGTFLGEPHLQDLLGGISLAAFERIFLVGFERGTDLEGLLEQAQAQGFELHGVCADPERLRMLREQADGQRGLLAELPVGTASVGELTARRQRLEQELEACRHTVQSDQEAAACRLGRLAAEIEDLEDQAEELERDAGLVAADLAAAEQEKRTLLGSLEDGQRQQAERDAQRQQQLREMDAQLARWRDVLHDLEGRVQRLHADAEPAEATGVCPSGDPRHYLRRLETRLDEVQQAVREAAPATNTEPCQCARLRELLTTACQALRDDVYRLCNELSYRETNTLRVEAATELGQLRRCETELRQAVSGLVRQREQLAAELATGAQAAAAIYDAAPGPFCRCAAHPEAVPAASPATTRVEDRLAELTATIARLDQRRRELADDLEAVRDELHGLREERRRLQDDVSGAADRGRLESRQQELDRVLQQLCDLERRQTLTARLAALEGEIRQLEATVAESPVLREASDLLRRLTGGQWPRISLGPDRVLSVQHRDGHRLAAPQFSAGGRDRVYLSLCLALVAAFARRGTRLPLILGDGFLNIDAQGTEAAAQLLRDFGQGGHQILLFTRQAHVATLFRSLGVAVRELPSRLAPAPGPELSEQERTAINRELDAIAEAANQPADRPAPRVWSAEEFPGELTDRVRLHPAPEPAPTEPSRPNGEFFLYESSPIQDAPSIDSATAERLRKIGVLQVRDLLRLDADDAAAQLRYAGITAAMLRRWQAESLLCCRVPHLRLYDARILVACGITDPEQLARLDADELVRRVEDFAATSTGQVLLRSGNRYELSRLTDWIRAARAHRTRRPTPRETARTPHDGPRGNGTPARHSDRVARPDRDPADRPGASASTREPRRSAGRPRPESTPVVLKLDPAAATWRFHLETSDAVVDAPSIGARLAERLQTLGIQTVEDLLRADPAALAKRLDNRRITAETVRQWQQQTSLACRIPELRGHDAQILVACGVTQPEQLAQMDAAVLWTRVEAVVASPEGKRIIRQGQAPDREEVANWIRWAAHARSLKAA